MTKESSLADQVRDARRAVSCWSEQKREAVRLEGVDVYMKADVRPPASPPSSKSVALTTHTRRR